MLSSITVEDAGDEAVIGVICAGSRRCDVIELRLGCCIWPSRSCCRGDSALVMVLRYDDDVRRELIVLLDGSRPNCGLCSVYE